MFLKQKPFKVANCDKNIGWAIMDNLIYDNLIFKELDENQNIYKKIQQNPLTETTNEIKIKLNELVNSNNLSDKLRKYLIGTSEFKLGKPRLLPKLHKQKFGTRLIINCKNHPTSNMCYFLNELLQPIVQKSESYIKDSQNLIQKFDNVRLDENTKLYALDFVSLYPNIDSNDAIEKITHYMSDKLNSDHITIIGFKTIIELIFFKNIFYYKNNFYIQINGISMGCICGPTLANLYVHILEKHWLNINRPLMYSRFIDDIFIASNKLD